MSTPLRLEAISALCRDGERVEKNRSQLLAEIDTTQPSTSQHGAASAKAAALNDDSALRRRTDDAENAP